MATETIWGWRLRVLMARTTSLEGRVSALEDQSIKLSQRSDDRWSQVKRLAELTVPVGTIIQFLARNWGVATLVATAIWTGARWLLRGLQIW